MKVLNIVLTVLVALLSAAAGFAKVAGAPEEIAFLSGLGLNSSMILLFGIVQIVGAILIVMPVAKLYGLFLICFGFLISAVLVFFSGNAPFGLISMLPVLISAYLIYRMLQHTRDKSGKPDAMNGATS